MILVDSSVWIAFFRGVGNAQDLNDLIDSNTLCINEIILTELLPSLIRRGEDNLKDLLLSLSIFKLNIDWNGIINMQTVNFKNGLNGIGIADLIIAQNIIQNNLHIYTLDKHFTEMSKYHNFKVY